MTAQRLWKQEQVQQLLRRLGSFDVTEEGTASSDGAICVNKVIGTDDVFGYRAKLTPHYDTPRGDAEDLRIGFLKASSRYIIDIDECIIALPEINVEYTKLRTKVRQEVRSKLIEREDPIAASKLKKLQGATLLLRQTDDGIATDPKSIIQQTVRGVKFRFVAGEFFQNNLFVLPLMVEHVLRHATSHGCTQLIDTYCGSGLFALCAASSFDNVWGVEVSAKAIDAANKNAILNNVTNAQFLCGVSEDIFGLVSVKIPPEKRGETAVIIDPPRAGCDEAFLRQLFDFNPKTLVYVSCDPATQARDAKIIAANGYSVIDVTPFDLFPQTRHIENVMVFLRP